LEGHVKRTGSVVAVLVGMLAAGGALADSGASTGTEATVVEADGGELWKKFKGSTADFSTAVGSGSFYGSRGVFDTEGYSNPYVASTLTLRPSYVLSKARKLSLKSRFIFMEELSVPDDDTGRRFFYYDPWFWLSAGNLYTDSQTDLKLTGFARVVLPLSPESRYANRVFGTALGVGLSRSFDLPSEVELSLSWSGSFAKNWDTKAYRGKGPDDEDGCRAGVAYRQAGKSFNHGQEPTTSDSDHCGGRHNTSFSFTNSLTASVSYQKFSFDLGFTVVNAFKYSFPEDEKTAAHAVSDGQSDTTAGDLSARYALSDRLGISFGLSSEQPALNSRTTGLRFPFFDFAGTGANNFTTLSLGLDGTL
jgi:hypothetical protein